MAGLSRSATEQRLSVGEPKSLAYLTREVIKIADGSVLEELSMNCEVSFLKVFE